MNAELIRDEGHRNPMTRAELTERLRGWLRNEYTGILFELGAELIGYALFTDQEYDGIHLRQFFVASAHRRQGLGREAFALLCSEVLDPAERIVVDVLAQNDAALAFWRSVGFDDYAVTLEKRSDGA